MEQIEELTGLEAQEFDVINKQLKDALDEIERLKQRNELDKAVLDASSLVDEQALKIAVESDEKWMAEFPDSKPTSLYAWAKAELKRRGVL